MEMESKIDIKKQLSLLSPEQVRGYTVPFAMGGGTGSSFASSFIEFVKTDSTDPTTVATFGLLPEFGWDTVIFESAALNIVMNLK